MTVPAPRCTASRPTADRPPVPARARRTAVAVAALCLVAATAAAAPPAPDAPTGCGDLMRGQLCLRGPVGTDGTYRTTYRRTGAAEPRNPRVAGSPAGSAPLASGAEITVRLGFQRKNPKITAFPGWFGSRRTLHGAAALSGRVRMLPDECIRGVMEDEDRVFVTKWSCG
ncbi:hypothetical protein [Streptomyces sp. NPDC048248]|uniref:hypothetical protein n=1 Tax=Streptomyces sp. NPDC048248 TaxID=3365523 RepID=UPI003716A5E2